MVESLISKEKIEHVFAVSLRFFNHKIFFSLISLYRINIFKLKFLQIKKKFALSVVNFGCIMRLLWITTIVLALFKCNYGQEETSTKPEKCGVRIKYGIGFRLTEHENENESEFGEFIY